MSRPAARLVAALSTIAVVGVTTAPAMAADPAAEASATGAILTIAGSPVDSGQYTVVTDGTTQTESGTNSPEVADVLSQQSNVDVGVIYQDATTSSNGGRSNAFACSGVAGNGAVVAEVGDGTCLTGGDQVTLVPGTIDLGNAQLIQSNILAPLTQPLNDALGPVVSQLLTPLSDVLNQVLGGLGNLGVVIESAGAIQSSCAATSTSAEATSNIADLRGYVTVAGQEVEILNLPVGDIAPNTEVVTNLDDVVDAILVGLDSQLTNGLQGALAPLTALLPYVQQINDLVIAQISDQLAPVRDNLLSLTLNKQSQPTPNSIEVTAFDLQVLPAASQFIGTSFASVELGKAFCRGGVYAVGEPEPTPTPTTPPVTPVADTPTVPTSVPAGMSGETPAPWGPAALVGMTLLAGTAGVARFVRARNAA
ncbi:hypothetical protein INN71_13070 [Nocardioides sp. ChNu-153]|uniref:hypothetical protein n=1 Tax=unclassified Nocardioides TaxID=2615069 RepID=UPI002405E1C1|nr:MULTISPECIES: hypothetical protein [unclassified Nocardioides]MDF9715051.1 hypothetical protein [Nocardioides sp. ChNu-99]MDN7122320.1 hypothetical protein [Nocardioides sp. ChNu-153]